MGLNSEFTYKIVLAYKGTRYAGWQFQTVNPETIQNHIETVLKNIVNFQQIQVIAASRTDTGVHASGQVLKITLPEEIAPDKLKMGMNSKLPKDIRVMSCEFIDNSFNVNKDAKSKEYHYYFAQSEVDNITLNESVLYLNEKLDLEAMRKACACLIGKYNFAGFCVKASKEVNTSREILKCTIEQTSFSPFESKVFYLKIEGTGFLKYMVRFIMGALFDIGSGVLSLEQLMYSLDAGEAYPNKKKVPANGLHLKQINY